MVNDLTWVTVEAYWDAISVQGNVIAAGGPATYKSGVKKGMTYDAVIIYSGGFWISKYTNLRYRQGIAERYVKRNEKSILKVAKKLMKKIPTNLEIGKMRRVGIQNTGIQSSRSASGIKYYPAGIEPSVILSFGGSFLVGQPAGYGESEASLDSRPRAEVL
tara:strand:- start:389 stop:871 length:483 start_codon:yes stop_codon:yes gene_type:complete